MITVYGIANCDKVRESLNWLRENRDDIHFHDFRKNGIDEALVLKFLDHFTLDELINRRGTSWRQLSESVKSNLSSATAIRLMIELPALIKRPIVNKDDTWLIGISGSGLADEV